MFEGFILGVVFSGFLAMAFALGRAGFLENKLGNRQ